MPSSRRLVPGTEIRTKAILFDMDGTIVDSTRVVERMWKLWADKHGLDVMEIMRTSHGRRSIETMRAFCPPGVDPEVEVKVFNAAEVAETEGIVAVPGAADLVTQLPRDRWAVVTSADVPLATMRIGVAGLPIPETLITAELVKEGKPDPEGYILGAERLGFAPEDTLVIEDAHAGIEAGQAAGARVLVLATTFPPERLGDVDWLPDLSVLTLDRREANGDLVLKVIG